MKLAVISHSAVLPRHRLKWRLLAKARGMEIHLIVPESWPEGGVARSARSGKEGKLFVHALPAFLAGRIGFFMYRGLAQLLGRLRPDFIYAEEEMFALSCWQSLRAAKRLGAKIGFFTWENIRRRYKPGLNLVLRTVLKHADLAVAGNAEAAAILKARGFKGRLTVLPQYGVDTGFFKPGKAGSREEFTVGYMGRLVREKGIDLLLKACAGWKVRVLIAGAGPLDKEMRNLAGRLGTRAEFVGLVPYEKCPGFYHQLDCLCLPSRTTVKWKEQFGRVLAEAMACGVPCVGSDSGAIPEVMGPAGLAFRQGDAGLLKSRLELLAFSKALRRKLGRAGRKRALSLYDEKKLAKVLEGLFKE